MDNNLEPAEVDIVIRPSSSNHRSADDTSVPNNGQYSNFGGGDTLINKLPPVIADKIWYFAALIPFLLGLGLLITFAIAVAALRQTNSNEEAVLSVLKGETEVLMKHSDKLNVLHNATNPIASCGSSWVNSVYNTCIQVPALQLSYVEARKKCQENGGTLAFPRDALEFSVLRSMAPTLSDSTTFLGLKRDTNGESWIIESSVFNIFQNMDHFWEAGEPSSGGNCAAFKGNLKMMAVDCETPAYYICGK